MIFYIRPSFYVIGFQISHIDVEFDYFKTFFGPAAKQSLRISKQIQANEKLIKTRCELLETRLHLNQTLR